MNSLADIALEYIESENKYGIDKNLYHYNCAEVLLNACNDYYKLNVSEEMLKAVIPFGGGMCSESTCGILTGSLMALGLIFAENKPTNNDKVKSVTKEWLNIFENKFGNINCKELKENHRHPEFGCKTIILEASELLEQVISKYL